MNLSNGDLIGVVGKFLWYLLVHVLALLWIIERIEDTVMFWGMYGNF